MDSENQRHQGLAGHRERIVNTRMNRAHALVTAFAKPNLISSFVKPNPMKDFLGDIKTNQKQQAEPVTARAGRAKENEKAVTV
ncbi:MAG: hypothetical protein U7M05_01020 [Candidatus Igneacidithiobacillus chanchocoensis]